MNIVVNLHVTLNVLVFAFFVLERVSIVDLNGVDVGFYFWGDMFEAISRLIVTFFGRFNVGALSTVLWAVFFGFVGGRWKWGPGPFIGRTGFLFRVYFSDIVGLDSFGSLFVGPASNFAWVRTFDVEGFGTFVATYTVGANRGVTFMWLAVS